MSKSKNLEEGLLIMYKWSVTVAPGKMNHRTDLESWWKQLSDVIRHLHRTYIFHLTYLLRSAAKHVFGNKSNRNVNTKIALTCY